jgi:transposase
LKFFKVHHSVRSATNERRLAELKHAVPLTSDAAILNSSLLLVKVLVAQLRTVLGAIAEYDRHIEAVCQTHAEYALFAALPGAGPVYAARLTAAFGSDRTRWKSADDLLCFTGIAPALERSGKQQSIRWRYFCPKFLRQSFHEYAAESVHHSFWANAYYNMQLLKGKKHP